MKKPYTSLFSTTSTRSKSKIENGNIDLSRIAEPESYRADLLHRLGGKLQFHFIVATFCEQILGHPKLQEFYESYSLNDLHKCQINLLNAAFLDYENFDFKGHIKETHSQSLDAGMKAKDFDVLVQLFQETLHEAHVEDDAIQDATKLLQPLRQIFKRNTRKTKPRSKKTAKVQAVEMISLQELIEMRRAEKIKNLRAKRLRSLEKHRANQLSASSRSKAYSSDDLFDVMEDMTTTASSEVLLTFTEEEKQIEGLRHAGFY